MRILVLDDDNERHEAFRARLREAHGEECVLVQHTSFEKFRKVVQDEERFDLIYLDHDLGDLTDENVIRGTSMYGGKDFSFNGQDAAEVLAALPEEKRPDQVIVHSWNPPGAKLMLEILREAGISAVYQPFSPPQWTPINQDNLVEGLMGEFLRKDDEG